MNRTPLFRAALAAALSLSADAYGQGPRPAGPALPATASGALAGRLVDAVNSPDTAAITRAVDAARPSAWQRDEVLATLRGLRDQGGGVTLGETRTTPAGSAIVQLWARRADAGVELLVGADTAAPGRLARFSLRASLRPGGTIRPLPRTRMEEGELVRALDDELRRLAAADRFSGVVLIGRGDRIVYQGAFGTENLATRTPITPASRFHIASMGKMFTSVAIAQLIQQGRLSLDDTLGALLPEEPWTPQARGITVRQLLSHRAGLGGLFDRAGFRENYVYATSAELLPIFASLPLASAPGERYAYSNEGFETLGAVVERLTGMRRNEYVARNVFAPSQMREIRVDALADTLDRRVFPQTHAEGDVLGLRPRVMVPRGISGGGAGGGHATAEDMFRFGRALLGGRLVNRGLVDQFTGAADAPEQGQRYVFGFEVRRVNGRTVFGHSGGGPRGVAICDQSDYFADGSWTVIVLSNYDAPFCADLKDEIVDVLTYQ
ncbi:MAG TPA: serine hydrolase domain-containing protein [Longimicrobium sp.]|jgi:CubicO group peptidase (beta-lactamase class C family)|uniref:serine hydrolase domain-containing protein n=1 Tax=Longimicrobium sp. TaxID=2029185 RepID=UPI002EDB4532